MAASRSQYVATPAERGDDLRRDDDQPADANDRHDLHRTDNDGQAVLIHCRNCGRTGFPGEIGIFEYCIGQGGTAGLRTDSMIGIGGQI